jgi:hypothetical protein
LVLLLKFQFILYQQAAATGEITWLFSETGLINEITNAALCYVMRLA